MSKIISKRIRWTASPSNDVVKHIVFLTNATDTLTYDSTQVEVEMPTTEYNFPGVFAIQEGNYKVGVAAVDSYGNISDITEIESFFDLTPPMSPTNLIMETVG